MRVLGELAWRDTERCGKLHRRTFFGGHGVGIRRLLTGAFGVLLACILTASVASAGGGYPSPTGTVVVRGNGIVVVEGTGCPPKSDVNITITTDADGKIVGQTTVKAGDDGSFKATINTGRTTGPATVTIECGDVTQILGTTLFVTAGQGSNLPRTGNDSSIPLARLGLVLVAAGGLGVYAARKRSSRNAKALA